MFLRQLKEELTDIPGQIRKGFSGADAGFQAAMLVCLGLGAVLGPLFITKVQALLLAVAGGLVLLRFLMRPAYRPALASFIGSKTGMLWLAFTGLSLIGALRTQYAMNWEADTPFLLVKPLLLLLSLFIWAYVRQTLDEPYARFLPPVLLAAMLLFLGLWTFENLKNMLIFQFVGPAVYPKGSIPFYIGEILEKNTALILVAPFLFLGGWKAHNAPPPRLSVRIYILMAVWLLAVSFMTYGAHGKVNFVLRYIASESVQIGMMMTLGVYLLALYYPRIMIHLFFAGLLAMVLFSPWIFQLAHYLLEPYFSTLGVPVTIRLEVWKAAAVEALKAPFLGHGMQYLDYQLGKGMMVFHTPYGFAKDHPHPHNMFLQLWINLGLIGVLTAMGIILSAWRFFLRISPALLPPLLASLCFISILAMSTHSLWQPYKMAMMALLFLNIYIQGKRGAA